MELPGSIQAWLRSSPKLEGMSTQLQSANPRLGIAPDKADDPRMGLLSEALLAFGPRTLPGISTESLGPEIANVRNLSCGLFPRTLSCP